MIQYSGISELKWIYTNISSNYNWNKSISILLQRIYIWECLLQSFKIFCPGLELPMAPILPWMSNYINHKVGDEITYPFPNFNSTAVEVWEWISNFIPTLYWACDYLSVLGFQLIYVSVRGFSGPIQKADVCRSLINIDNQQYLHRYFAGLMRDWVSVANALVSGDATVLNYAIKLFLNSSDAGDGILQLWGSRSIPFLLMPLLLKSSGHQQAWYSQYRIGNT